MTFILTKLKTKTLESKNKKYPEQVTSDIATGCMEESAISIGHKQGH
jgi:hypothetical protein